MHMNGVLCLDCSCFASGSVGECAGGIPHEELGDEAGDLRTRCV